MKLTKTVAALAAASALVIMAATPASATVHNVTIEDGTLTTTTLGTFDLGPTGTPGPCTGTSTDTDTLTINETAGTGTNTNTVITAASLTSSLNAGTPTAPYEVLITKHTGNNNGTITSTGAVTQGISARVEFRAGCTSTGTLVCTAQVNGTLTGTITNLPGMGDDDLGTHPLTTSTKIHLSGTSLVTTIPLQACSAPFSTLLTTTVTFTSLELHV